MYLIKAGIKKSPSISSVANVLMPDDEDQRFGPSHKLAWSLFSGADNSERKFLYREKDKSLFIMSPVMPSQNDILNVSCLEIKTLYDAGSELSFLLRANPIKSVFVAKDARGKRVDVIMRALHSLSASERAEQREIVVAEESKKWLQSFEDKGGFKLQEFSADGYRQAKIRKSSGGKNNIMSFSVIEMAGRVTVTDSEKFEQTLINGVGGAKAFGCGMMMVRQH